MKTYISKWEAIAGLHERGFTEDFELYGCELLWIQQKIFLQSTEFSITECHLFQDDPKKELLIYAVTSGCYCIKGILINHDKEYTTETANVVQNKVAQQHLNLHEYNY
jgi:hypothetical protein